MKFSRTKVANLVLREITQKRGKMLILLTLFCLASAVTKTGGQGGKAKRKRKQGPKPEPTAAPSYVGGYAFTNTKVKQQASSVSSNKPTWKTGDYSAVDGDMERYRATKTARKEVEVNKDARGALTAPGKPTNTTAAAAPSDSVYAIPGRA